MKSIQKIVSLLFLISAICGCEEAKVTSRDYPRINTLPVSDLTTEGVMFNAEIIFRGDFEVTSYGFVWGRNLDPNIEESNKISFSDNIQSDTFSSYVTTEFHTETLYLVRSFIETEDFLVYGENIIFSIDE